MRKSIVVLAACLWVAECLSAEPHPHDSLEAALAETRQLTEEITLRYVQNLPGTALYGSLRWLEDSDSSGIELFAEACTGTCPEGLILGYHVPEGLGEYGDLLLDLEVSDRTWILFGLIKGGDNISASLEVEITRSGEYLFRDLPIGALRNADGIVEVILLLQEAPPITVIGQGGAAKASSKGYTGVAIKSATLGPPR